MVLQRHSFIKQFSRLLHARVSPRQVGISLVRSVENNEQECLYPSFRNFNVETKDRCHSFQVPCDRVVKFIKLGAINKQIATQYCHYLASLTRDSEAPEDAAFYASKCIDLMSFLLKNDKDIPVMSRDRLLSDCATTTKENCKLAVSQLVLKSSIRIQDFSKLLGACYRFGLWEEADKLIEAVPLKLVTFRVADDFVQGVISASEEYKRLANSAKEQAALKARVTNSMTTLCRRFTLSRAQMITKQKADFIKALKELDFNVKLSPTIKLSGRCTGCETHLPLFDHKLVSKINSSIRSQLFQGAEKGLFLNTSPNDVQRFDTFLRDLYEKDRKPIDCVIDGLNIAYRSTQGYNWHTKQLTEDVSKTYKTARPESLAQVLINSIIRGDMLSRFKKILVVGKWHMTKWPLLMDFFKSNQIYFYSSFNNSKDDLFQLFAATLNPKTVLVTNDFLRDHLAGLNEDDRAPLERWIDTHQTWIDQRTLKPIWPTPYEKIPSTNDEGNIIHFPVIDYHQLHMIANQEPPPHLNNKMLTWICCDTR